MENSKKKPDPKQCVKGVCKAISDFCNVQNCPSVKQLDDVEGIIIFFFRNNRKVRIHSLGEISLADFGEAAILTLDQMFKELPKEFLRRDEYAA